MSKICKICKETKAIDEFSIARGNKDGRSTSCRPCYNIRYNYNPDQIARRIHAEHVRRSAEFAYPAPTYDLNRLKQWIADQDSAIPIWDAFELNHDRTLEPTVVRIDPQKPYTLENLRLTIRGETQAKRAREKMECTAVAIQNAAPVASDGDNFYRVHRSLADAIRGLGGEIRELAFIADGDFVRIALVMSTGSQP